MAPTGQGGQWQDVLCCTLCNLLFEQGNPPVSLICGHVICRNCSRQPAVQKRPCPNDDWKPRVAINMYPTNVALLSVILPNVDCMCYSEGNTTMEKAVDRAMIECSRFFRRAESERGGSVYSHKLSRTLQRKVVSLICYQWIESDGKVKCLKACRAIAERIMTEILLSIQSNTHVSGQLWTAVRARGCQFLGPAMQEDVLRLILITLESGTMIARKNLVMYVVTTLVPDYSQVSKTCVGHVVQLLYRASCFNVIKRDGESSLMQLKEEFRTYDSLRREHDSQIVQIAFESGLRIGPDQWSALLYADQGHRSHMQSIIDKLQSPNSYAQCLEELMAVVMNPNSSLASSARDSVNEMMPILSSLDNISYESPSTALLVEVLEKLVHILKLHAAGDDRRRYGFQHASHLAGNEAGARADRRVNPFKTRMCTNVETNGFCEKGINCSFAHSAEELRNLNGAPKSVRDRRSLDSPAQAPQQQHQQQIQNASQPPPQPPHQPPPPQPPTRLTFIPQQHHGPPLPHPAMFHKPPPPMNQPPPPMPHFYQGMPIATNSMSQQSQRSGSCGPPMDPPPPPSQVPLAVNPNMPPPPPGALLIGYPTELPPPPQQFGQQNQGPNGNAAGQPPPLMIMQSPNHMPSGPVVMMPPPNQNAVWAAPSPTGPANLIFPGANSPGQHPHTIWINSTQTSMFPMEFDYGGGVYWGAPQMRDSGADADQLLAKRNEILNRLAPPLSIDDDDCEDGGIGHVSYTVASSVLDDTRMEGHHSVTLIGITPGQAIDLPAMPVSFGSVPNEETMTIIGDIVQNRPRAGSLTQANAILAPNGQIIQSPYHTEMTSVSATVQSECGTMSVMESICQPIVTPSIQTCNTNNVNQTIPIGAVVATIPAPPPGAETFVQTVPPPPQPGQPMLVDGATGLLTPLIRPILLPTFPQDVVSCSLDKIVDVKERISEAQAGSASEAENEHLRRELRQAESEMAFLDPYTKNNCLLRELQQVDHQLQQFQIEPTRTQ